MTCTRLNPRVVKRGESGGGEVVKWWRLLWSGGEGGEREEV